jgi:hypothetical protein
VRLWFRYCGNEKNPTSGNSRSSISFLGGVRWVRGTYSCIYAITANSIKLAFAYHLVLNCGRRGCLVQLYLNAVFRQAFNSNDEEKGWIYVRTCRVQNGYRTEHVDVSCTYYSKTCLKRNAIVPVFFSPFSQVSGLQRVVF